MYSQGGAEEVFTKGGDKTEAGVAPPVWRIKRFEQGRKSVIGSTWTCKVIPEPP